MSRLHFTGGETGAWRITAMTTLVGDPLPTVPHLHVGPAATSGPWTLQAVPSNQRYTERTEDAALKSVQEPLGRPHAHRAALIPIRKNAT